MKINLISEMDGSGVGRHAKYFYQSLKSIAGEHLRIQQIHPDDKTSLAKAIVEGTADDITIFFVTQNPKLLRMIKGKKILWCAFESDRMPALLVELLDAFDEIWAPSEWGRGVMIASGLAAAKIKTVPEGVDAKTYFPNPRAHDGFIFLSVAKYEKRKSVDKIIEAYAAEFPAAKYPDIFLWLKPDFPLFPERLVELKSRLSGDARIKILEGYATDSEMAALYNAADAFLFPSRAEGFGLPCLEALSCGAPTVAVNYSGQSEYLKTIPGLYLPIEYRLENIEDPDFDYFYKELYAGEPYGKWANPDAASLRRGMREIYESSQEWKNKAAMASQIIRQNFDWNNATEKALAALGVVL